MCAHEEIRPRAVLLVGPTGSGKSPAGMVMERWGGFRHFDFGAELRAAAAGARGLMPADVASVQQLLRTHALLPDERFGLAELLLRAFLARNRFDAASEVLVLNGLPRRVSQAVAVERLVHVAHVVALECDEGVARQRVARRRRGEGIDHVGRDDDLPEAVARKLALYAGETRPLIAHYEAQASVRVSRVRVKAGTSAEAIAERVAAAFCGRT